MASSWRARAAVAAAVLICGCTPEARRRVEVPDVDPEDAAEAALQTYDKNGDGALDGQELAACPALRDALKRADTDGDGSLSGEEIAGRIERVQDTEIGAMTPQVRLRAGGRPVGGADLTLVPEAFQGEALGRATGKTSPRGMAVPNDPALGSGVRPGFYKVRVTGPGVPAKYSADTPLGCEIAPDGPEVIELSLD